jgi:AraC-like DNA-binding protein
VATEHRNGFVFRAEYAPHYVLLCFRTPFFCILNGRRYTGEAGDCVLQRPGTSVVHGPLSEDAFFVNDWIYFDADAGEIEALELPFDRVIHVEDSEILVHLIDRVMKEAVRSDCYSARLVSDSIYRMLVTVKRAERVQESEEAPLRARFRELRVRILHRYGEAWSLQRMAELSGYSVSRFCALYTGFFGVSPMNDLLSTRLEKAKQLLSLGVYKVGEVAAMCGFSSIHYFSNYFKRNTGIAPTAYENQA